MVTLEQQVNALVGEFDAWFQSKGNDPLVRSEVAILKTFAWYLANEKHSDVPGVTCPVEKEKEDDSASGG